MLKCHSTETKFSYPLIFAQSIVSNMLIVMMNFIFAKSKRKVLFLQSVTLWSMQEASLLFSLNVFT